MAGGPTADLYDADRFRQRVEKRRREKGLEFNPVGAPAALHQHRRRAPINHTTLFEHRDPIAEGFSLVHRVCREHDRGPAAGFGANQAPNPLARDRIEPEARLIQKEELRRPHQCGGKRNPPPRPSGQIAHHLSPFFVEAQLLEKCAYGARARVERRDPIDRLKDPEKGR